MSCVCSANKPEKDTLIRSQLVSRKCILSNDCDVIITYSFHIAVTFNATLYFSLGNSCLALSRNPSIPVHRPRKSIFTNMKIKIRFYRSNERSPALTLGHFVCMSVCLLCSCSQKRHDEILGTRVLETRPNEVHQKLINCIFSFKMASFKTFTAQFQDIHSD